MYKPVSQSRTVTESEKFWQATGQSNLADRMEDCFIGHSAVMWVQKPNFGSQVWISSGHQNFKLLVAAHDCDTGHKNDKFPKFWRKKNVKNIQEILNIFSCWKFQNNVCFSYGDIMQKPFQRVDQEC